MTAKEFTRRQIAIHREIAAITGKRIRRRPMPRMQRPTGIQLAYFQALRRILDYARTLVKVRVQSRLTQWSEEAKRHDAAEDEINEAADGLASQFFDQFTNERLRSVASDFARRTAGKQKTELGKQVKAALGVDVVHAEPWLEPKIAQFTAENVGLIKSVASKYFGEIEALVMRGIRDGLRPEEIAGELQDRFGVAEDRAQLIARDQLGKFFGDLNERRQQDLGVTDYIWRTVGDVRVRGDPEGKYPNAEPSHFSRDGKRFSWSDPPPGGHPGEAIQCRCYSEPVLDEVANGGEG